MWVRGRDAHIYYNASNPADTITFEIQNAIGAVVYTLTKEAPGADGHFVFPVSYQTVSGESGALSFLLNGVAPRALSPLPFFYSPLASPLSVQPPPDCYSCFLVAVSNTYPDVFHVVCVRRDKQDRQTLRANR